jgi:hypothetical protein
MRPRPRCGRSGSGRGCGRRAVAGRTAVSVTGGIGLTATESPALMTTEVRRLGAPEASALTAAVIAATTLGFAEDIATHGHRGHRHRGHRRSQLPTASALMTTEGPALGGTGGIRAYRRRDRGHRRRSARGRRRHRNSRSSRSPPPRAPALTATDGIRAHNHRGRRARPSRAAGPGCLDDTRLHVEGEPRDAKRGSRSVAAAP